MAIFVDTSAIYALLADDDSRHAAAAATFSVLGESEELVTHGYVVSEAAALVQRRLGPEALRTLLSEVLEILDVEMAGSVLVSAPGPSRNPWAAKSRS